MPATSQQQPSLFYPYPEIIPHSHSVYKIAIAVLLIAIAVLGGTIGVGMLSQAASSRLTPSPYSIAGTDLSSNWSGYISYNNVNSTTDVKGTWTVPNIVCSGVARHEWFALWVGMDGGLKSNGTLEQAGTISRCVPINGVMTPVHVPFVEWLPAGPKIFHETVNSGETIAAEVRWNDNMFIAEVRNLSEGWTITDYNTTIGMTAKRASVEWIAEAPSFRNGTIASLADFDKVYFSNCFATTDYSHSGPMGDFPLVQYDMVDARGFPMARPVLPLWNDGTIFSVWWVSPGT